MATTVMHAPRARRAATAATISHARLDACSKTFRFQSDWPGTDTDRRGGSAGMVKFATCWRTICLEISASVD